LGSPKRQRLGKYSIQEIFVKSKSIFHSKNLGFRSDDGVAVIRLNKENIHARAYIAFKNEDQLTMFGNQYDAETRTVGTLTCYKRC
jgi:hypothetical protein